MKNRSGGAALASADRWLPWLVGALVFLVYAPALRGGFLFDDRHVVVENAFLREPRTLGRFFLHPLTSSGVAGDMYRPLTTATFMLNYAWGGLRPFGYHLVNVLLHLLNGLLLWRLLRPAFSPRVAAFGAALFLLHPVHSNAVAYITSRSTLLAAAGVLGALVAYRISRTTRCRRAVWRLLSLAAFAGAMLSKETGVVLPGLLVLLDLTVWRNGEAHPERRAATWRRWMPFLLLGAAYLLWRRWAIGAIGPTVAVRPGWFNLGASCQAVWRYVGLFVAPDGLCLTRQVAVPTRLDDWWANGAMLGYVGAIALTLWWRQRRPARACALGWFLIALFPSHPMGSLHLTAADHHAYLPSVGLVLGATALLALLHRRWRLVAAWGAAGVIVLAGLATFQRSRLWRDPVRVWESTVRAAPGYALALNNLGLAYERQGRLDDAERAFRRALRLDGSEYAMVIGNIGRLYAMRAAPATALPLLRLADAYQPETPFLMSAVGFTLSRLGRYAEAEVMYRRTIARNPAIEETYNNWGVDLALQDRRAEALAMLQRGLPYDNGETTLRRNLGLLLYEAGRPKEAAEQFLAMARSPLGTGEDLARAAALYETWGRPTEAAEGSR